MSDSLDNLKFAFSATGSRPPLLFPDDEYLLFANLLVVLKHNQRQIIFVQNSHLYLSIRYQDGMVISLKDETLTSSLHGFCLSFNWIQ